MEIDIVRTHSLLIVQIKLMRLAKRGVEPIFVGNAEQLFLDCVVETYWLQAKALVLRVHYCQ